MRIKLISWWKIRYNRPVPEKTEQVFQVLGRFFQSLDVISHHLTPTFQNRSERSIGENQLGKILHCVFFDAAVERFLFSFPLTDLLR